MSKFKVGEVVILESKDFPQFNGREITVIQEPFIRDEVLFYITDFEFKADGYYDDGWNESALRKMPNGNEIKDWSELSDIWIPNKITEAV